MEKTTSEVSQSDMCECVERLKAVVQSATSFNQASLDTAQSLTARLLILVTEKEKAKQQLASCSLGGVPYLVSLLEHSHDPQVLSTVILILKELLISKKVCSESALCLSTSNAVRHLFHLLINYQPSQVEFFNEDFLTALYMVLARISGNDRRFPVKARLCGVLPTVLSHIKLYSHKPRVLQNALRLLCELMSSAYNASSLTKDGLVPVLLHILCTAKNVSSVTYYIVEALAVATRSKCVVRVIVENGSTALFLQMLDPLYWNCTGRKGAKLVRLFRGILQVLLHVASTRNGRQALCTAGVFQTLIVWCQSVLPTGDKWDKLVLHSSIIIQRCLPPLPLPVGSLHSPLTFALPQGPPIEPDNYDTERDVDNMSSSSDDNDQDDEKDAVKEHECIPQNITICNRPDEMKAYATFFPEMLMGSDQVIDAHVKQCVHSLQAVSLLEKKLDNLSFNECNLVLQSCSEELQQEISDTVKLTVPVPQQCHFQAITTQVPDSVQNGAKEQKFIDACQSPTAIALMHTKIDSHKGEEKMGCDLKNMDKISQPCIQNLLNSAKEVQRAEKFLEKVEFENIYRDVSKSIQSVLPIKKLTFSDLKGCPGYGELEPLSQETNNLYRSCLLQLMLERTSGTCRKRAIVYDLDILVDRSHKDEPIKLLDLCSGKPCTSSTNLEFYSCFESGNLRKAYQIGEREYDLILNPDINTSNHHQWFYFEVSAMDTTAPYIFNIVNFEKSYSAFDTGMCPLLFSVKEHSLTGQGWKRVQTRITYYRNHFVRANTVPAILQGKPYYTLTFSVLFLHVGDVCYLAYHYPYTYSLLQAHLHCWENSHDRSTIYFKRQELCRTLCENPVPLLTITAYPSSACRPYIFLSGRVHPGESNASWVMKGTLDFLLSNRCAAQRLREMFIFKVIPMLNPDGVINGSHRCSLVGQDLNRQWKHPRIEHHPPIYHVKALLQFLKSRGLTPWLYCDYHGHSRRQNVFLYGCSPSQTWHPNDKLRKDDHMYELLPLLLHHMAPAFNLDNCSFVVDHSKEATARVTVWREFDVAFSYTMECTYGACDIGMYEGYHLGIAQLEEMGRKFCQAVLKLWQGLNGQDDTISLLLLESPTLCSITQHPTNCAVRSRTCSSTFSEDDEDHTDVEEKTSEDNLQSC